MAVPVDTIITLVRLQLGLKTLQLGDRIIEDLGAESLDVVNLISAVEEKYHIAIEDSELSKLQTVSDLHDLVTRHMG